VGVAVGGIVGASIGGIISSIDQSFVGSILKAIGIVKMKPNP
jgi:hypothetical protein